MVLQTTWDFLNFVLWCLTLSFNNLATLPFILVLFDNSSSVQDVVTLGQVPLIIVQGWVWCWLVCRKACKPPTHSDIIWHEWTILPITHNNTTPQWPSLEHYNLNLRSSIQSKFRYNHTNQSEFSFAKINKSMDWSITWSNWEATSSLDKYREIIQYLQTPPVSCLTRNCHVWGCRVNRVAVTYTMNYSCKRVCEQRIQHRFGVPIQTGYYIWLVFIATVASSHTKFVHM